MKKILFVAVAIVLSNLAFSQTTVSKEKQKLIKEYLNASGGLKAMKPVMDQLFTTFEKMLPDVPATFWTQAKKEFNEQNFVDLMAPIYDKYFTEAEIQDMINFYKTPTGKKLAANMDNITQDSMAAGQEFGKMIAEKVIEKLRKEGYKVD